MPAVLASAEALLAELRQEIEALDPDALVERLDSASELASLDLDSMTMMSVIAEIERTHSIELPNERLSGLRTVGQVIALVQSQMAMPAGTEAADACKCC